MPKTLRLCKSLGKIYFLKTTKLVYLTMNFSWNSKALNLRQPNLSAPYKESVVAISECYFLNLKKLKHRWTLPPPTPNIKECMCGWGDWLNFQNFIKKRGSDFFFKNGGVGKLRELIFILTNLAQWKVNFWYQWIIHIIT